MAGGRRSNRGDSIDANNSSVGGGGAAQNESQRAGGGTIRRAQHFRRMIYVDGIKPQIGFTPMGTFKWEQLLDELRSTAESDVDSKVVPVALFGNPPLGHFLKVMHTGLKVFWLKRIKVIDKLYSLKFFTMTMTPCSRTRPFIGLPPSIRFYLRKKQ